ncbi:MAG: methyltransferase domain-containing protein [Nocardioidaceae bacterium]|nr:methyltransferase domain-containing protein [Nocardioidaceae bacterium]NUS50977.1 methyltransferase domain-containing protein [Nocardioidaceae bacterium]
MRSGGRRVATGTPTPGSSSSPPSSASRTTSGSADASYADPVTPGRAEEIARNRALWAVVNERFTGPAAAAQWGRAEVVWGLFAVPDRELGVLGDVRGLDVLELAAGTAYCSAWLARGGARPVALDLSAEQLATARALQRGTGPAFPLLQADAERVPLVDGSFDLVVSEHGAAAWCDPERWLPEAARLLRPGGRLVFLTNSLLSALCVPDDEGVATDRLHRAQRSVHHVTWPGGGSEFHPSHGEWIRLLRGSGFVVEALHEIYAPADATDHPWYEIVSPEWARQWPAEELWVARAQRPGLSRSTR